MRTSASKILDRTLLLLFLTALLWIVFQRIYQNLPLSLLMSGISIALLRALFLRIQHRLYPHRAQRKAQKKRLELIMEQLSLLPLEQAAPEAARLWCLGARRPLPVDSKYGVLSEHEGQLTLYKLNQRPAGSAPMDAPELLRLHHAAQSSGARLLVVLNTGRYTPAAHALAGQLHAPSLKLVDGDALRQRIQPECCQLELPEHSKTAPAAWRTLPKKILSVCRPGRAALYGALMLPLYLTLGNPLYLICSLISLALAALSLHQRLTAPPA